MFKVSLELPAKLEDWCGVLLQDTFPEGFVSDIVKGDARWIKLTGWTSSQRRLNQLRRDVEVWGGRRFLFSKAKIEIPRPSVIPAQRLGPFMLLSENAQGMKSQKGIVIRLRQGQAFGTGLHESTRLILKDLAGRKLRGLSVLDIGAGTGVLSFAALGRGAACTCVIEKDFASRKELKINRALNKVRPAQMKILPGAFPNARLKGKSFDLVLANLVTPLHLELLKDQAARLKKGGQMVLSGISGNAEAASIIQLGSRLGLKPGRGQGLKSWRSLVFTKPA